MQFNRMIMEKESPEELGYDKIKFNLSESSIADRRLSEVGVQIDNLLLFYGDHGGIPGLRHILGGEHYGLTESDVLVCAGACMSLFVVNATLLSPRDRILVVQPNYATNIEVPKSLEIGTDLYKLTFEDGFALDLERVEAMITPSTKLISVTYPHNPTGAMIDKETLLELVAMAERHGIHLLVDETYRELTFGEKLPPAAALSKWAISVESVSKSYGVPGIRIGWIANQDPVLMERFLSTKEQIVICNSVVDEQIAYEVLKRRDKLLSMSRVKNEANFETVKAWMAGEELLEWVEPKGGVVCFPRFKPVVDINLEKFYSVLLDEYSAMVGRGRWFDEDDRYFRVGYGWPSPRELAGGLDAISQAALASLR